MNFNKSLLSAAVATALTGVLAAPAQAAQIDMSYTGLFTMLTATGAAVANTALPYYYDATWGYGKRSQISGTMSFDTVTGAGSGTVAPFQFFENTAVASGVNFQSIGGGLMLGAMTFSWGTEVISTQIVLDGSGLFTALGGGLPPVGAVLSTDGYCTTVGSGCATPASGGILKAGLIGPSPIATSTFNTAGQTGAGTTLGQLSLGSDDGIGGSPMDNSSFSGFNANFDMTSVTVTAVTSEVSAVPVPAAVWLFGSGLIGLVGVARRRKQA